MQKLDAMSSVLSLRLSSRALTVLATQGIGTIGHLCQYSEADLHKFQGAGVTTCYEIVEALTRHGFSLATPVEDAAALIDKVITFLESGPSMINNAGARQTLIKELRKFPKSPKIKTLKLTIPVFGQPINERAERQKAKARIALQRRRDVFRKVVNGESFNRVGLEIGVSASRAMTLFSEMATQLRKEFTSEHPDLLLMSTAMPKIRNCKNFWLELLDKHEHHG